MSGSEFSMKHWQERAYLAEKRLAELEKPVPPVVEEGRPQIPPKVFPPVGEEPRSPVPARAVVPLSKDLPSPVSPNAQSNYNLRPNSDIRHEGLPLIPPEILTALKSNFGVSLEVGLPPSPPMPIFPPFSVP